jgi:tetratricopeptide (TPR) repeat protein
MAACMEGRYSQAKRVADRMSARLLPHAEMMPVLDTFLMAPIWVDVRFGKWTEILARHEPMKELAGTHVMWRYSRAIALAAGGMVPEAEKERELFVAEVSAFPPDAMLGEMNKARAVLGVASHVVDARIAAAKGQTEAAIEHWTKAVAIQDTLNYNEPADWYYPVRESLGAALLGAGKAPEAEAVFRVDLQQNPRNPRSLYGLTQALRAQSKVSDAGWVETQFNAAWKNADTDLTISAM